LAELLFTGLTVNKKVYINKILLLPDLAEETHRIKGNNRNYLIQKLKENINNSDKLFYLKSTNIIGGQKFSLQTGR